MSRIWGAVLSGHVFDLQDWREVLLPPHSPWVEQWTINEASHHVLRSSGFEQFDESTDVWNAAKLLTTRVNGAFAAERNGQPLAVERIAERRPDGSIAQHAVFSVFSAHARVRAGFISASMQIGPTTIQRWLELADKSDLIDDLLRYQSEEPNWYALYKGFEVIRELCGGQRILERRPWCPARLSTFTHTANLYRHSAVHSSRQNPPSHPMPIDEATGMIRDMTREALQETLVGGSGARKR